VTLLRPLSALSALSMLAACGGNAPELKPVSTPVIRATLPTGGLNGKTESELQRLFGQPLQENIEGAGKRLQYARNGCVMDAYLYPLRANGQLVVTHIDTRRPTGEDVDQPSCLKAFGVK
jgi:hypothetical protein